ncbi:MAG: hypothetical protein WC780_08375 [Lentimicrobiaceae bacterium]|jgi:hypothetical protein
MNAEIYPVFSITAVNLGICPAWHPGAGNKFWLFVYEIDVE